MSSPGTSPETAQATKIPVHVNHADDPNGRIGTFTGPGALVRVKAGDTVQWQITPATDQFTVSFPGFWPFQEPAGPITRTTGPLTAKNIGSYHYQISVSDGTNTWTISNCPEIVVEN
jgi:plastocyanin